MNVTPTIRVLHVASVFPANSNRLALQCQYAKGECDLELLHLTASREAGIPGSREIPVTTLPHWPPLRRGNALLVRRLQSLVRRVVNAVALYFALYRSRADLVHAHEHSSLAALAFWVLVLRRPAIWDPHDYFHEAAGGSRSDGHLRRRATLERAIVRRRVPIVAVSSGMHEKYRELYPDASIIELRNFSSRRGNVAMKIEQLDARVRELVAMRSKENDSTLRLVYAGLIKPERFSLDLVMAIASIDGVSLDIYGEDRSTTGVNQAGLTRTLRENRIQNVHMKGPYTSDSIVDTLLHYHYVLIPYRVTKANIDFCLPNKFYQCIEAGVPVIASSMKEMGAIIEGFRLGYVFPAGDESACIDLIRKLSRSDPDYARLVRNVLSYQLSEVDYEGQASQLVDTYKSVIGRR